MELPQTTKGETTRPNEWTRETERKVARLRITDGNGSTEELLGATGRWRGFKLL